MKSYRFIEDKNKISLQLNKLAREQMKEKLLTDILIDLKICELEGFNKKDYIYELRDLLNSIKI